MKKIIKYSLPVMLLLSSASQADSLKDVVKQTINNNTEIESSVINNQANKLYIDEELGGYYPKVDLTANISRKRTETNSNSFTETGNNIQLDVEQLIYDGGLTIGRIGEAKHRFLSNKYANANNKEFVLLESIQAYLNLAQSKHKLALTKDNLALYESYLKVAQDNETINGIALDRYQADAKVQSSLDRLLAEENNNSSILNEYERIVGSKPKGLICAPEINRNDLPATTKVAIRNALKSNFSIMEQVENINEQREVLNQADSANLPTLKFKLQSINDTDLITRNTDTDYLTAKVELKYNLFNGGSDMAASEREKLFLIESQKVLDTVSAEVVSNIASAYDTYTNSLKRIEVLKKQIEDNKQILSIYKDQFDAGTRSFIDVLNVEGDLFNSRISLIDVKYEMLNSYYEVFAYLSKLEEHVLSSKDQVCTELKIEKTEKQEQIILE